MTTEERAAASEVEPELVSSGNAPQNLQTAGEAADAKSLEGDTENHDAAGSDSGMSAADVDATVQLLGQHRQANSIIDPPTVECSCDAILPLPFGNFDWPNAEQLAMIRHHAEILAAAKLALPDTPDQVTFDPNLRPGYRSAPEGWSDKRWHQTAIYDSGTSHTLVGPAYVIQCEWCPQVFIGKTKTDAMALFRVHENDVQVGGGHR